MSGHIRKLTSEFSSDESGQSLLFCALTIFSLIVMVGLIAGVGEVTTNQMKLQAATDAAAYSAVAVQADCMAQIALINEGMAAIYKEGMSEAVSNVVSYTDKSKMVPWWNPGDVSVDGAGNYFPEVDAYTYDPPESDGSGSSWVQQGKEWYLDLARMQRLIAIAAPTLIKAQAYQAAHANFYDPDAEDEDGKPLRLAIFPTPGSNTNPIWEFYPEGGSYHNAVLVEDPDGSEGWFVYSESDPGYEMSFSHNIIDETVADSGTLNEWHVVRNTPDTSIDFLVRDTVYAPFKSETAPQGKKYGGAMFQEGHYELTINGELVEIDMYAETAGGDVVMAVIQPSQLEEGQSRDIIEKVPGGSIVNGTEYSYDDNGFNVDGENVGNTMTVNGMEMPVNFPSGIGGIRFEWPLHLSMKGLWASFNGGINVHYYFNGAIGWIKGMDDKAYVRGFSTTSPDDRWTWRYGATGRIQHRLTEYESEKFPGNDAFRYEVSNVGSYLEDMSIRKLAVRAMMMDSSDDVYPSADFVHYRYVPLNALPPKYASEERIDSFKSDDAKFISYESSVWDSYASGKALWACPRRVPADASQANGSYPFGGFFSIDKGQPYDDYAYSVTLEQSPYAQKMQDSGKCYDGAWIIPRRHISGQSLYNYIQGNSHILYTQMNPLWRLYAKVSRGTAEVIEGMEGDDADTAANDDAGDAHISLNNSNKYKCGFYVLGPFADWSNNDELRRLVNGLGDYYNENLADGEKKFYIDDGIAIDYPFFAYNENGSMFIAIWDPYGAAAAYVHQPRYPDTQMHQYYAYDHDAQLIPWSTFKANVSAAPARVRRYIYHGKGIYNKATNSNDYLGYAMGLDISNLKIGNEMIRPLQATSQVFRMPVVTVGWVPALSSSIDKLFGKSKSASSEAQQQAGRFNPLVITNESDHRMWNSGHFAYAAARVFMRKPFGESESLLTNFAYVADSFGDRTSGAVNITNAALNYPNEVNQITQQRMSGNRQYWIDSAFNLFEPVWSAALVPLRSSLKLEDVVPESEIIAEGDTATAFLMRTFRNQAVHHWWSNGGWIKDSYQNYYGSRQDDPGARRSWLRITAPPMQGGRAGHSIHWNGDSGSFDDVVRH